MARPAGRNAPDQPAQPEPADASCPCCGATGLRAFHRVRDIPVSSAVLVDSRAEALAFPRRDLCLAFCGRCGFITNVLFDAATQAVSDRYEGTQGFSPTFAAFARDLARRLVERYGLAGKRALEIGCGTGEFLELLCEVGMEGGVGIDPSWVPGRGRPEFAGRLSFVAEAYSRRHAALTGDLVCCRHTLEHLPAPREFLTELRAGIGARRDSVVVFELPDVVRILREGAFWDVYYEHCSYFSPVALRGVFVASGFRVVDLWREYDEQYLLIAARPAERTSAGAAPAEAALAGELSELGSQVAGFEHNASAAIARWREVLAEGAAPDRRTVIWGAGSKGVAFLTTLGGAGVEYAVDVNPHKQGKFLPGAGQQVVAPEFLRAYRPARVIVMNPVYVPEIGARLRALGVSAELLAV